MEIDNHLRTPEQCNGLPAGFVRHLGIPYLGRAAIVYPCGYAGNASLSGGT